MRQIGEAYVAANAVVVGDIVLSPGVNIWYHCVLRGDLSRITLGRSVNLQDGVIMHTDEDSPQELEDGVVVGHGAILHGRRIGRDSLIGMGARLLSGSTIGAECLIAAGALVTEGSRIPARSLVMGVPGKVIRALTDEEVARIRETNAHYLAMAQRHARGEFPPPWRQ